MIIASLTLCLFPFPADARIASDCVASYRDANTDDPEFEAKLAAAGKDVAKLLTLATGYSTAGQDADAKKVYRKILEIDPSQEAAHKALGHQFYDKKWFDSFAELAKYKREEASKMKAKGLVRFKDEWVSEADLPFLNMGWVKDANGEFVNPVEVARAKEAADHKAAGDTFRPDDNSWVVPGELANLKAVQWKCGKEWVDLAKANEFHSKPENAWELIGEHFTVTTTCDWEAGNWARWYADKSYPELVRIFGVEPKTKPEFIVLNGLTQYNQAAGGNPPTLPESEGFSSLHGAYFADQMFDLSTQPPQYQGAGVSFWDRKDEKLKGWGPYWLRWAAGQSFVDAIDPSWGFVGEVVASAASRGPRPEPLSFWAEKKIPRWFRYGAASYIERYMKNPEAAEGKSPWDLRDFAFGEIKKTGGLQKLEDVFAFKLDIAKPDESTRLYHESGLVVAYLMDGAEGDKKVKAAHEAFKAALKSGVRKDIATAVAALQKELAGNEREIKKFAGL
jgi:hypothetical protein